MPRAFGDLVEETTVTAGTGSVTLAAVSGRARFSSLPFPACSYVLRDANGTSFEIGIGTQSGNVLTRTTVTANHLGTTALITLTAGTHRVYNAPGAREAMQLEYTAGLSPMMYGAKKDGVTNDLTAINNCIAAANTLGIKMIDFGGPGTYYLGAPTTAVALITIPSNLWTFRSNGARFLIATAAQVEPMVFFAQGKTDLNFLGTFIFEDTGGAGVMSPVWLNFFSAASAFVFRDACLRIVIDNVICTTMTECISFDGSTGASDITINSLDMTGCGYGLSLQNNGSNGRIGLIRCKNSMRSFLLFGANNWDLTVHSKNNTTGYLPLIYRYGQNTRNIRLRLSYESTHALRGPVMGLQQSNADGANSIIENIDIHYFTKITDQEVVTPGSYTPVVEMKSQNADLSENSTNIHTFKNIRISGSRGNYLQDIGSTFSNSTPQIIMRLPKGYVSNTEFAAVNTAGKLTNLDL